MYFLGTLNRFSRPLGSVEEAGMMEGRPYHRMSMRLGMEPTQG